jgi:hypothetical protein
MTSHTRVNPAVPNQGEEELITRCEVCYGHVLLGIISIELKRLREDKRTMTEYTSFRQRLDAVLRTLDVKQVSDFLIAEKQWSPGKPADPEFAMWMMVVSSAALQDLHAQARSWLVGHGHAEDARAFLPKEKQLSASNQSTRKKKRPRK